MPRQAYSNRETVGEPVEPLPAALPDCCLRLCRIVACGLCRIVACGLCRTVACGLCRTVACGLAGLLPAGLPDCCLRLCRTVACGLAGPLPAALPDCCLRACRTTVTSTGQRPVEVLVTMVMLWSTKAPLRASWDP